jgi:aryl-alcohol dehydrogenase-like predicted oxidoreductase
MTLEKRKLGRTSIEISPIGLGVMQFAGGKGVFRVMYPEIPQATMKEIIKTGVEGGINWFDTAELYGGGRSERFLANSLRENNLSNEEVIIATKWSPLLRTARNIPRTIGNRQRFLNPYTVDLYQIHQPISFSSPEEEMKAMADLVEAGKIRAVGVSNFDAERMRRAHAALEKRGLSLASNQVQYSLLHRNIESNGILDAAKELGITIIAWGPLASGLLSGVFHKDQQALQNRLPVRRVRLRRQLEASKKVIDTLDEIAKVHHVTIAQVAMNWLIHFHGDVVVAIPGASKVRHARDSAGVMNFKLTEDEMARIDEVSRRFC